MFEFDTDDEEKHREQSISGPAMDIQLHRTDCNLRLDDSAVGLMPRGVRPDKR